MFKTLSDYSHRMDEARIPVKDLWSVYYDYRIKFEKYGHKGAADNTFMWAHGEHKQLIDGPVPIEAQEHYRQLIDSFKDRPM